MPMNSVCTKITNSNMTSLLRRLWPRSGTHRLVNEIDIAAMTYVGGRKVPKDENPGIRVEKNIIKNAEQEMLIATKLREIIREHGFVSSEPQKVLVSSAASATSGLPSSREEYKNVYVTPIRVTGREENQGAEFIAPWRYGDDLIYSQVPECLSQIDKSIRDRGAFALGKLRDITINYRQHSMFKLDPHFDPSDDGENVIIVSLCSDTVVTFTHGIDIDTPVDKRPTPEKIAYSSWSDEDIDVVAPRRSALLFCDKARYTLKHAIRNGVVLDQPGQEPVVCDWWGEPKNLIPRKFERISCVFAYAKP